ncbi:MAG: transcription termination factor Rho [Fuerstiella sp.]
MRRRSKSEDSSEPESKSRKNSRETSSDSDEPSAGESVAAVSESESGGDSSSEGSSNRPAGESDEERPRRRRRRRRRGGRGENSESQGSGNAQSAGGQNSNNQGGGNNRGGGRGGERNSRGGRGRGQQGGGQGRGRNDRNDRGGRGSSTRRSRNVQASTEVIEGPFEGVLEMHPKGYGFLRDPKKNYAAEDSNPFVSASVIEKYKLREGVLVKGEVGAGSRNQGPRLQDVDLIDGYTAEEYEQIAHFDDLTPINPHEQIKLEIGKQPVTMRVMDLLCPIGKGQRALLVAPPRTGKTMLLQDIANSVTQNHPEVHLMVLLIDERPEEVTEMTRSVKGEVIASSLDHDVESHVRIAQLIIERGKRLAEEGQDVFILLDSITRLARAYNKWVNPSGRTGRGGLDIRALDIPKKLFGTARLFDEGGSLTVCGTALIETNNGMDEAIFQEFKGTGNMEMVLSRDLAERRIWPAIDIGSSGTRREEKILDPEVMEGVTMLRRSLIKFSPVEAMEQMTRMLSRFDTNDEFLKKITAML